MIFHETEVVGVVVVEPTFVTDNRGYFARTFSADQFSAHQLATQFVECSTSFNGRRGTVRGLHYQVSPHEEAKLVRCTRGAIYDVSVDVRRESPTFLRWVAVELSADNAQMVYVAPGVAHGFQTVADMSEVYYEISERYTSEAARGVRWDDDAFGIHWPLPIAVISERDRSFPDFVP